MEPWSLKGERWKAWVEQRTGDPLEHRLQVHLIYMVVGQPPVAQRPFGGRCQGIPGASQNLSSFLGCWRAAFCFSFHALSGGSGGGFLAALYRGWAGQLSLCSPAPFPSQIFEGVQGPLSKSLCSCWHSGVISVESLATASIENCREAAPVSNAHVLLWNSQH